jgi:alkylated DNA nucleotide flippase Atl1
MRKVPKGKVTTINEIRATLAKKHGATICCPLTAGIFANIAAHAAEEQKQQGKTDTTPYWRILKKGGIVNPKYPGRVEGQKKLLEQEGHTVIQKGKNYAVKDYEKVLAKLD